MTYPESQNDTSFGVMNKFTTWLGGKLGPMGAIIVICGCVLVLVMMVFNATRSDAAGDLSRTRAFVCSETGKGFDYVVDEKTTIPVKSPYSGKNTGYPAEKCYLDKDGKIKNTPNYVLLNETLGKPGPTFCPECGRMVVQHNPIPDETRLPPTREEYQQRRARKP